MFRRLVPAVAALLWVAACGAAAAGTRRSAPAAVRPAAVIVYTGTTGQHLRISLIVDRRRSLLIALRFTISYACTGGHALRLRAAILRPEDSWGIVDRSPRDSLRPLYGFSDWFSGPTGHDFHITGTVSAGAGVITGTLHSLLRAAGAYGRCDSGHMRYRVAATLSPPALPHPTQITLAQYRALPSGITIAAAQRRLRPPADRDRFAPTGVIGGTLPGGAQPFLDYAWRGHPDRYFQFFFHSGRLIAGMPGRSIALR